MDNKLAILPMHVGTLYAIYSLYLHVYIHVHPFVPMILHFSGLIIS